MSIKIVHWRGHEFTCDEKYNWLAQDGNGGWWVYTRRPRVHSRLQMWHDPTTQATCWIRGRKHKLPRPEPGPWTTQLYWIGD